MEERIFIVAPRGRDAQVVEHVLSREGMQCVVCPDVASMVESLQQGAACALIADEALDQRALRMVDDWLSTQPPWSDFPFVLLGGNGKKGALTAEGRRLEVLGNVMLIERPMSGEALVSAARGALRARRRQYQARAMIASALPPMRGCSAPLAKRTSFSQCSPTSCATRWHRSATPSKPSAWRTKRFRRACSGPAR
ncbi:hypothetical protein H3V53_07715 [Paraburkholderia bengalensis]|uniref:Response regulatory domain-containing protein n=1 Tax=Paraburkholderia bengalensis TaxID=2747562 RepID=A0ABU8INB2_9BURK